MEAHTAGDCIMREVQCPYADLGCQNPVRLGKMSDHLFDNADNHLRMLYAAESKVSARVGALESWAQAVVKDDEHRREGLQAIDTALLTLETKHSELDKSHTGSKSHVLKLESRIKDLESMVKKQSTELAAFRKTVDGLRQSFAQIAKH
jgi:chromosome segregation ATPase